MQNKREKNLSKKENTKRQRTIKETYGMLQIRIDSLMKLNDIKVIAFTCLNDCDEISLHIFNIAKSMVLENKRVLIVDCGLATSKMQKYLEVELNNNGEENIVMDEVFGVNEVPGISGLNYVSNGSGWNNSEEIIDIEKLNIFINNIKDQYDIILIDSPPAGTTAEGLKLSMIADGTVLVALAGKTSKLSAKHMKDNLKAVNAKILGVILA